MQFITCVVYVSIKTMNLRKSQIPIEICARTHWAAPPRDLTAGDQLYATNSVLPESRAASASHATNSILPESQAASASHATKSALEQTRGQQCPRSRRALEAAGGIEHSGRALAGLARREGARGTSGGARGNLRTVK